jgi:DNA polymerase
MILKHIGDASRAFVCEEPGYELFGGDYSGFESAYLATVAGETWKRDAWEKYLRTRDPADDPYRQMGAWFDEGRPEGKVYDLAWGFGGGPRSFLSRNPNTSLSREEIQNRCYTWRERHPAIASRSGFWHVLHAAAITAVHDPSVGQTYKGHKLYCRKIGNLNFLFIELPSGRAIAYPGAHLVCGEHNGKPTVAIGFMDNAKGQWKPYVSPTGKAGSWHGLLVENVVQAGTRDIMAATMLRLEAAGYEVR